MVAGWCSPPWGSTGVIELDGVVKRYRGAGEEVRAVSGVDLTVEPGEMVALLGPSGSGKTTLLLLIAALLAPDEGSVRYDGLDLSSLNENEACDYLLRDVGFVYQNFHLMPRVSAIENASIKLLLAGVGMREAQARASPWLERVGLGDRLEHTPAELSRGEGQRGAVARALAHERRAAVVLVTHDAEAAAIADRRLTLRDGRLVETHRDDRGDARLTLDPHSPPAQA